MTNLQKIVVLCLLVVAGLGSYYLASQKTAVNTENNQNNSEDQLPVNANPDTEDEVEEPQEPILETPNDLPKEPVACTMDAKVCPDGSFVGRVGPNCEFAACPSQIYPKPKDGEILCDQTMKRTDLCLDVYQPVCGLVQVQCIQAPCPPVEETFSNSCYACTQGNVISYTEGACEASY